MNNDPAHVLSLWQKMIDGDQSSLGDLFNVFGKELINYAYKISLDKSTAKDAVQDVFVDLWHYRSNLSQEVQVKFYLYRSVKRAVLRSMKWLPSTTENIDTLPEIFSLHSSEAEWIEDESEQQQQTLLEKSLQNLSQREREVVSLKYYGNLKLKEIAEILELKEQTIANTLQNALLKLRKYLKHLPALFMLYLFG